MNHFLVKTDPDTYGLEDLIKEGETLWDGVHSFAAIAFIKQMRPGDTVYVYESQGPKSIMGIAKVSSEPFENKDDPRPSWAVRIAFVRKVKHPLSLAEMKAEPALADFALVKQPRLSVMPVPPEVHSWLSERLG
jgi:predicted RNA-binding protein with PUA-like domain